MKKMLPVIFLFAISYANANDTAFGGSGASPIPIEQTHIKMASEHIIIKGEDLNRQDMRGRWIFFCNYLFKNLSPQTIHIKMGFPFPIRSEESETTTPAGYTTAKGGSLVHNFLVTVNGQPVAVTKYNIGPNLLKKLDYKEAYIWPMTFMPQATAKIEHRYITGVTYDVVRHIWVTYVLKTGALWRGGKIDTAKFEVIPNTPTRLCSEIETSASYLKPTLPGLKISGDKKQRKYSWNLQNFTPTTDLNLCLYTGKNFIRYRLVLPILNDFNNIKIDLVHKTKQQLWILRNTVYAQYGKRFQNPILQKYFNQQWWYVSNANYSDSLLTTEDKQALDKIITAEQHSH